MQTSFSFWPALIAMAFALPFSACKRAADQTVALDIPIGEFASLTGATASFGRSSHNGTKMAIDEINEAGGVLGKNLRLITEDDQSRA